MLAGLLLLSCQAAMGILFFQHRGTPLLKALGGPLCGLGLISLMGSCISLVLYLGQPNDDICRVQILLYVMFPTVALSTILAISMQVSKKVTIVVFIEIMFKLRDPFLVCVCVLTDCLCM